jgi:excisionase family DNA binding protein
MPKVDFEQPTLPSFERQQDPSPRHINAQTLDELLTVDDVAARLKVRKSWVYEHTRGRGTPCAERLPHIKIGKYVRFEATDVRAFLEKKCRPT